MKYHYATFRKQIERKEEKDFSLYLPEEKYNAIHDEQGRFGSTLTHDQLIEASEGQYKLLSTEQKSMIFEYTANDYKDVNIMLRKNKIPDDATNWNVKMVNHITEALDGASLPESVSVTRMMKNTNSLWMKIKNSPQGIFEDKGFISTSLRDNWSKNESKIIAHINVPKGAKALYISPLSNIPKERELLLQRGSRFQIQRTSVDSATGDKHIYMVLLTDTTKNILSFTKKFHSEQDDDKFTWGKDDIIWSNEGETKNNPNHSSANGQFISVDDGDGGVNADVMASMPAHIAKALSDKGAMTKNEDGSYSATVNGKKYHIVPVGSEKIAFSQAGASRIAQILGASDVVPPVHAGEVHGEHVVLAEDTGGGKLLNDTSATKAMEALPPKTLTKITMLEYLLGVKQDGSSHYLLDHKTGTINLTQLSSALVKKDIAIKTHSFLMKVLGKSHIKESIDHGILSKFLSQKTKAFLLSEKFSASPEAHMGFQKRFEVLHQLAQMKKPTWEDFFKITAHPDGHVSGKPPKLIHPSEHVAVKPLSRQNTAMTTKPHNGNTVARKKPGYRGHGKAIDLSLYMPEKKYNPAHDQVGKFTTTEGAHLLVHADGIREKESDNQVHQKVEAKYTNPEEIPFVKRYMETGEKPKNISTENGDGALDEIYKAQGFDGKPNLVEDNVLATHIQSGEAELFRGVGRGEDQIVAEGYAKDYQSNSFFAGLGMYGNGTYTAIQTEGIEKSKDTALGVANSYGGSILHMSVLPETTAIDYHRLQKEQGDYISNVYSRMASASSKEQIPLQRLAELAADPGRYAAMRGYDAIYVDHTLNRMAHTLVILNRTATRVQKTLLEAKRG